MTGKERLLTAIKGGRPDRMPISTQMWHPHHLRTVMGGMGEVEAYLHVGFDVMAEPYQVEQLAASPDWIEHREVIADSPNGKTIRISIETLKGRLTHTLFESNITAYTTEHLIKTERDAELFLQYYPSKTIDKQQLSKVYDLVGDHGIVRGLVPWCVQPGPWQEFCELVGMEKAIFWTLDDPQFVHHFLDRMTQYKVDNIHKQLSGAKFDLFENGGAAASSNVISPTIFDEFCVPYDRQINQALHEEGFLVAYHTCGAMMAILTHIPANGCDASETLTPRCSGGDIESEDDRRTVKRVLGSQVSLIGGMGQNLLEQPNSPQVEAQIAAHVHTCFEAFGAGGGYICSSGQFLQAPPENLKACARAAAQCIY